MSETKLAVVVLNYNGKHFLEKFLHGIISFSGDSQIYVADNKSTDDSLAFCGQIFPSVHITPKRRQLWLRYGLQQGAFKKLKAEYFVLLNSDVEVTQNWT